MAISNILRWLSKQAEISELECRDAELKLFEKSPDIKLLDNKYKTRHKHSY